MNKFMGYQIGRCYATVTIRKNSVGMTDLVANEFIRWFSIKKYYPKKHKKTLQSSPSTRPNTHIILPIVQTTEHAFCNFC